MPIYQRAVLYCRIATEIDGSMNAQEEACRKFAEERGYDVVEVFSDITPGSTITRAGFEDLLAHLKKHKGTIVIINDLGRLARDLTAFRTLREQIWQAEGKLQSLDAIFPDDPGDSMIDILMEAMARKAEELDG